MGHVIVDRHGTPLAVWRWGVERTFGRLMHHRRLARDYETHSHRSEAITHVAMIDVISRRLTRELARLNTYIQWFHGPDLASRQSAN